MSIRAYQQPGQLPAEFAVPSEPSLNYEPTSELGGGARYPSGPGVSRHAYDEPHVFRTAGELARRHELEHLDFAGVEFLGFRRQGEASLPALVVSLQQSRTLILRTVWKDSPDPDRPTLGSEVFQAQEVRLSRVNLEQPLTDADILSLPTELDLDQMKAIRPILKHMNTIMQRYIDAIEAYAHAKVRATKPTTLSSFDFQGVTPAGRDGLSGKVLLQVGSAYFALEQRVGNIYAEQITLGKDLNGAMRIETFVSEPYLLKAEEIKALHQAIELGSSAAKSLFPQDYENNGP